MQLPDWHSPRELLAFILTSTKRIVVLVVGLALVALGIALIPLPGPGLLVSVGGLAVLATEFVWAERMLDTVKVRAKQATDRAKRSVFRRRDRETPAP
jgi:uncharacterized protein (TIGR02611 family)